MAFYQLEFKQLLPANLNEVWAFISNPANLKHITPAYMGFDITSKDLPERMYPGMIISYKVRPFAGIRLTWITEITQIHEKEYFIDEQRSGPYALWHHQHKLEPVQEGVLMTDIISYKPPMGILGALANKLFIKDQLHDIFSYRKKALEQQFKKDSFSL